MREWSVKRAHSMISYAQNLEDVLLARAFRGKTDGFYVDAGAWHPVTDSVTKYFYELGWHGINIEPVDEYLRLLAADRPRDLNLGVALGERAGRGDLHCFTDSGLSTLRRDFLDSYDHLGFKPNSISCEITTLAAVCERYVTQAIDFLKIDVEGWEAEVIRGGDWSRFRPRIVVVEAVLPNPEAFLGGPAVAGPPAWEPWEGFLCGFDYELVYFDGLNRFYVRAEDRDLRAAFLVPPNVFDQYAPWKEVQLTLRVNELTAQADALKRERDALLASLSGR